MRNRDTYHKGDMNERIQKLKESLNESQSEELHPFSVSVSEPTEEGMVKMVCAASGFYRSAFFRRISTYFNIEAQTNALGYTISVPEDVAKKLSYALTGLILKDEECEVGDKFDEFMSLPLFMAFLDRLEIQLKENELKAIEYEKKRERNRIY